MRTDFAEKELCEDNGYGREIEAKSEVKVVRTLKIGEVAKLSSIGIEATSLKHPMAGPARNRRTERMAA